MKLRWIVVFSLFGAAPTLPQTQYHFPLRPPYIVSGTFGELRSNHFHSGIDFSTRKKTGLPVFAVEVGFVCRIKVAPDGYGNALYLRLRDGNTAVYAHLESFSQKIEARLWRQQQKEKNSFVDFTLSKEDLPVARGEQIGFSGDSGEVPPHLHFEIRDPQERPLNPLKYFFSIPEERPPKILGVNLVPLSENQIPSVPSSWTQAAAQWDEKEKIYALPEQTTPALITGIEVAALDDNHGNRCAPLKLSLYADGQLQFKREYAAFSFDEYPHPFAVYNRRLWSEKKGIYERLYLLPNAGLAFQKEFTPEKGGIRLEPNQGKQIKIVVEDSAKNVSVLLFTLKRTAKSAASENKTGPLSMLITPDMKTEITDVNKNVSLSFPKNAVYFPSAAQIKPVSAKTFLNFSLKSPVYEISPEDFLLRKNAELRFSFPQAREKGIDLYQFDPDNKRWKFLKGQKKEGEGIRAEIGSFGFFALLEDRTPPEIKNFRISSMKEECLLFEVADDLSGVDFRNVRVSSGKNSLIFQVNPNKKQVSLRLRQIPPGSPSRLAVSVPDFAGNTAAQEVDLSVVSKGQSE